MSHRLYFPLLASLLLAGQVAQGQAVDPSGTSPSDVSVPGGKAATGQPSKWSDFGKELALAEPATATTQEAAGGEATSRPAGAADHRRIKIESPFPVPDYGGDLLHREYATGDWGGVRQELANKGLTFDLWLTQVAQGNALGGRDFGDPFVVQRQFLADQRARAILALLDRIDAARNRVDAAQDRVNGIRENLPPITLPLARELLALRNAGQSVGAIAKRENLPPAVVEALIDLLKQKREDLINAIQQNKLSLLAAVEGAKGISQRVKDSLASAEAVKKGAENTRHTFDYGGSVEFSAQLDTTRADLWPGGLIIVRGLTQYGEFINRDAGAILPPCYTGLLPAPDAPGLTTLSEFYILQGLSEQAAVIAGKIDLARYGDLNEFASDEKMCFMNTGLRVNPVLALYAPYTAMGTGLVLMPTQWLRIGSFVLDPDGSAKETGFETAFHSPDDVTIAQEFDFTLKPLGLTGHQRAGWLFSHQQFTELQDVIPDAINRSGVLSRKLPVATRSDDAAFYYNFDQYFIQDAQDPNQGIGLFGRYGHSSGQVNPIENFYSIGVGGKGMIPTRPRDGYGVGYYYTRLSDDLPRFLQMDKEQGVEIFYTIEVTPWLRISPDMQVIVDPGGSSFSNTAIVYGLRATMRF